MKKILFVYCWLGISLCPEAYATYLGPYGAVGLGWTEIKLAPGNIFNADSIGGNDSRRIGDWDGKILLGYNFNKYFGLEGSFSDYAPSLYNGVVRRGPEAQMRYTMSALNLVCKVYYPLRDKQRPVLHLDPYLLGGGAEVYSNVRYTNSGVPFAEDINPDTFTLGNTNRKRLRPLVGLGFNYDVYETMVSVSLEFTFIIGTGDIKTNDHAIPNASMYTVNLSYNFSPSQPINNLQSQ